MRNWTVEGRMTALAVTAAIAISIARHGVFKPWDGWEHVTGAFIAHFFAVIIVSGAAGVAIKSWHKLFLGTEADFNEFGWQARYYTTMTLLIGAIFWAVVSTIGPHLGSFD